MRRDVASATTGSERRYSTSSGLNAPPPLHMMFPFGLACGGSLPPHGSRMASVMPFPCSACDSVCDARLRYVFAIRVCDARPQSDSLFASCSIIPVRMAFFQPFQAVLNPKSPVFVTTKAGEPLIAQRLTRPNKPRCLSAGPLRPPSAYRIRGSAARAPVRLRPLPGPRW